MKIEVATSNRDNQAHVEVGSHIGNLTTGP